MHYPLSSDRPEPSDEELIEAFRGGNQAALEQLIIRYQPNVYRFGVRMCRDPEDAKDILQDTMLTVARSLHNFRGPASTSTWLYSIARSFCAKKHRKSKFAPRETSLDSEAGPEASAISGPGRTPEEAMAGRQVEDALEQAIRDLKPEDREVLLLRDAEGLSAAEVAEVTGSTIPAVKSRLHRARTQVRREMVPLLSPVPERRAKQPCPHPDVATLFSRYLEDEISADVCARMEEHLEDCDHCRATCDSLKETLRLCSSGPGHEVPEQVQDAVRGAIRGMSGGIG